MTGSVGGGLPKGVGSGGGRGCVTVAVLQGAAPGLEGRRTHTGDSEQVEELATGLLRPGDVLEDGRVVSGKAFGPSSHDPAVRAWFDENATYETFCNSNTKVRVCQGPASAGTGGA